VALLPVELLVIQRILDLVDDFRVSSGKRTRLYRTAIRDTGLVAVLPQDALASSSVPAA